LKVETDAILVCSSCGVEGEHELLCFSEHVYAEYAWDVAGRTARLPRRFVGDVFRSPSWIVTYPVRALRKPFSLFREISQVAAFERKRRFREVIRRKDAAL
jgi:hypothetical protein